MSPTTRNFTNTGWSLTKRSSIRLSLMSRHFFIRSISVLTTWSGVISSPSWWKTTPLIFSSSNALATTTAVSSLAANIYRKHPRIQLPSSLTYGGSWYSSRQRSSRERANLLRSTTALRSCWCCWCSGRTHLQLRCVSRMSRTWL